MKNELENFIPLSRKVGTKLYESPQIRIITLETEGLMANSGIIVKQTYSSVSIENETSSTTPR